MSRPERVPVTVDAYLAMAARWSEGERYELIDGELVEMNAERNEHAFTKYALAKALEAACRATAKPFFVWPDGGSILVDETTALQPDAMVQFGGAVDLKSIFAAQPMIVAEVLSPGTQRRDMGPKLHAYFRAPSIEHYFIVDIESRRVIHHARVGEAELRTRFVADGVLRLDPPGAELDVAAVFAAV